MVVRTRQDESPSQFYENSSEQKGAQYAVCKVPCIRDCLPPLAPGGGHSQTRALLMERTVGGGDIFRVWSERSTVPPDRSGPTTAGCWATMGGQGEAVNAAPAGSWRALRSRLGVRPPSGWHRRGSPGAHTGRRSDIPDRGERRTSRVGVNPASPAPVGGWRLVGGAPGSAGQVWAARCGAGCRWWHAPSSADRCVACWPGQRRGSAQRVGGRCHRLPFVVGWS